MYVLLTTGHFDRRVVKFTRAHPELKKPLAKVPARIIHEGFYYNRRYPAGQA